MLLDISPKQERITASKLKRPSWLRVKAPVGERYQELNQLITKKRLNTVCSSASCPNIGECWEQGTATFMILGRVCTRACRFCDVDSFSRPKPVDLDEPNRLAFTIESMKLEYAVITSVTRDDLPDGGAGHFVNCLKQIKERMPLTKIEVLTPDFQGNIESIAKVLKEKPHVFNHNLETVERLTPKIRSGAKYKRSLQVLKTAKELDPSIKTKSGLMLGLGETIEEVKETLVELKSSKVNIITIGQYLRPSTWHHPVIRYALPSEFSDLKFFGEKLGFEHVVSSPLTRSSYHAKNAFE